jgi:SAM-dependent methyltransferase
VTRRQTRIRSITRNAIVRARFGGRRYRCPCCGMHARLFLPYGTPPRSNRACPSCGSLQRHRVLAFYLRRELNISAASRRILHVAPERAIRSVLGSLRSGSYVTIDVKQPTVSARADLARLPFPDAAFNIIICSHVLEHIPNDVACMAEMQRVLTASGRALIMVPVKRQLSATLEDPSLTDPDERLAVYGHREHVRYYGSDVADRLRTAGFAVDEVDMVDHLAPGEAERAVVRPGELIYVCRHSL